MPRLGGTGVMPTKPDHAGGVFRQRLMRHDGVTLIPHSTPQPSGGKSVRVLIEEDASNRSQALTLLVPTPMPRSRSFPGYPRPV